MAKATAIQNQQNQKSSEYVNDSSDTDESELSSQEDRSSKDSGDKARPSSSSSSSGTSEQEVDNASDSDDSSPSSNTERSIERKRKGSSANTHSESRNKKLKTNKDKPGVRATTIKPPSGYHAIKLNASDFISETASMFTNLDAALRGESILHHKGIDYSMFAIASKSEALLLPKGTESEYSKAKVAISRNFHLREMPQNKSSDLLTSKDAHRDEDSLTSENVQFFAKETGVRKPPRQQPVGLLMRYQPYGDATTTSKSYRLPNPDSKEDGENGDSATDRFTMPSNDYDAANSQNIKTPKKNKHSKHSHSSKISKADRTLRSDPMEVDTMINGTVLDTPESKIRKSSKIPDSEKRKKRKKDRKEKI